MIRAVTQGVRIDGRHLVLMPWEDYARANQKDRQAVAAYLLNGTTPVDNEVPAPSIRELFIRYDETVGSAPTAQNASNNNAAPATTSPLLLGVIGAVIVVVIGGILMMVRRRR